MYEYRCTLVRCIDGDTVDADIDLGFGVKFRERIRLYGIDAPEVRTRDLEEKRRGKLTTARLNTILRDNNNQFYLKSITHGKYGRCVGIIYLNEGGRSVNSMLIEENLATPYTE